MLKPGWFVSFVYFAPSCTIEAFEDFQEIAGIDGTFFKGVEGYTLLSAYTLDANNQVVLLAHGLTIFNESRDTWKRFLKFILDTYNGFRNGNRTVFSDQDKGIYAAF